MIRVGLLFPLSHGYAELGAGLVRACELALEVARADGLPRADGVELVPADAHDGPTARAAVTRLLDRGVVAIVGSELSAVALEAAPLADSAGVLFWEVEAVVDELLAEDRRNVLRFTCDASSFGATPIDFAIERLAPALDADPVAWRWAFVHEDTAYGRSTGAAALRRARKCRIRPVMAEGSGPGGLARLASSIAALGADVVVSSGYSEHAIRVARGLRTAGSRAILLGAGAGFNTRRFADALGSDAEGVFATGNAASASVSADELTEEARRLRERHAALASTRGLPLGEADLDLAFQGTLTLLRDVVGVAASMRVDHLRDAARRIDIPDGGTIVGFGVRFDSRGQNARAYPAVHQWQGGRMRSLFPRTFATAQPALELMASRA